MAAESSLPAPLPLKVEDSTFVDRLESSVRSFLLRAANKANCFYTVIRKIKKMQAGAGQQKKWWLDLDDEDEGEFTYTEKHYVALPSIVFSNSENPRHMRHLMCLASPPPSEHEAAQLNFENNVLVSMDK